MKHRLVVAARDECVHVAGVMSFPRLAEATGWRMVFLGPAAKIAQVLRAAREGRFRGRLSPPDV